MCNLIAPQPGLPVAFGERRERAAGPKRFAHVADSPFHASFLIAGANLARARREVIVCAQIDQARMKGNVIAAPLHNGALQVVVEDYARLPVEERERMHVAAQEVFHGLIEEKLQVEGSRVRQRHHETGQRAFGAAHHHRSEVRPIDLSLLTWKRFQLQKRFARLRTQSGDGAPQLSHTAQVAAVADHRIDARSAKPRMLFERLLYESQIRIDDGGAHRLRAFELLGFNGVAHCVGMYAQLSCNGSDLPMFGIKIAPDLGADFRGGHRFTTFLMAFVEMG